MNISLSEFDWILVNSSAGKDSQAMLDLIAEKAKSENVASRVVVFHADLGRIEWPGTADLAKEQADNYSFRFEKISRPQGDLLSHIESRGKFPDAARRYCTSDHKRGQGRKLLTQLTNEIYTGSRPVKILNCMGFRKEESPARAKKQIFKRDDSASNKTKREVFEYCPILDWSEKQVWNRIRLSGVRHHWAYDAGMPRLSCSFCVLASKSALVRAAQLRPDLARKYADVEQKIGHSFKKDLPMSQIIEQSQIIESVQIENWTA